MTIVSVLYGAAIGITRSLYGWSGKEDEPFDFVKFGKTAIIGAVVGGLAAASGLTFESMSASLQTMGILTVIDYGATALLNRIGTSIWKRLKK